MRYRKGRHPTTVNPHGIPTDVVDVQMGAHDRFTLETETAEHRLRFPRIECHSYGDELETELPRDHLDFIG